MRVFRAAIALLLSSCAAQHSGADTQHIEEIFVTDDGSVRFGAVTISDFGDFNERFRALSRQTPQDLLLIRSDYSTNQINMTQVRVRAYDAGVRFVMMTNADAVCERDRIHTVATPNSGPWLIRTTAGHSFEIPGSDALFPTRWRAEQNLLICPNWWGHNLFDVGNVDRGEELTTLRLEPHAILK